MRAVLALVLALLMGVGMETAEAQGQKWVTSWAASVQGPYPIGNPSAQPDQRFIFPDKDRGAKDQTFRMIVRPTVWGKQARIRLSNAFGMKPVTINGAYVGMQLGAAAVLKGTSRAVTFGGKPSVTIEPGKWLWSDPVNLAVRDANAPELQGRKLAVSFHVAGESGPMTWHAKALQTSYVTAPGVGAKGNDESETHFPYSTASWFFLDALDMRMPADSFAVIGFGDSITDGTLSTMNGDDRWPDVLARRLYALHGNKIAVLNAGIGGNQIAGPAEYGPQKPFPGGPSGRSRIDRDVLELSSVNAMIWLEGTNDFSKNGNASVEKVTTTLKDVVAHIRAKRPDMRLVAATVTSALGATNPNHGFAEQDEKRKALNEFLRTGKLFDEVVDFEKATLDPATGQLKAEMVPDSTKGDPGDKIHPNRAGYLAMGMAVDLAVMKAKGSAKGAPAAKAASAKK